MIHTNDLLGRAVLGAALVAALAAAAACDDGGGDASDGNDDPGDDLGGQADAGSPDASEPVADADLPGPDAAGPAADAAAPTADAAPSIVYNCGAFTEAPTWTITPGFHAVVVADAADGLNQPVAAVISYGGRVVVVNQGNATVTSTDPLTGDTTVLVAAASWPAAPALLTTAVHDRAGVFDGALYVGDQGGDGDADSRIFRVGADGTATTFVAAPGPGLDDIYGLAFAPPGSPYPAGLYVTGDTDGAGVDWGVYSAAATGAAFSEVAGCEGITFDSSGTLGGGLLASCPAGGGYAGNDAINRIDAAGAPGVPLATTLPGVHAVTVAPAGPFGARAYAASWSSQKLLGVDAAGAVTELASGLALTNYDGNILTFSPDGLVLFVADRQANRLVCIEPLPGR